jgi:hypothetical protein
LILLLKKKDPQLKNLNADIARALVNTFKLKKDDPISQVKNMIEKFQTTESIDDRNTLLSQLFNLYVTPQVSAEDSNLLLQFFYFYSFCSYSGKYVENKFYV